MFINVKDEKYRMSNLQWHESLRQFIVTNSTGDQTEALYTLFSTKLLIRQKRPILCLAKTRCIKESCSYHSDIVFCFTFIRYRSISLLHRKVPAKNNIIVICLNFIIFSAHNFKNTIISLIMSAVNGQ